MKRFFVALFSVLAIAAFADNMDRNLWGKTKAEIIDTFGEKYETASYGSILYDVDMFDKGYKASFAFRDDVGLYAVVLTVSADDVGDIMERFMKLYGLPSKFGTGYLWITGENEITYAYENDDGTPLLMVASRAFTALSLIGFL